MRRLLFLPIVALCVITGSSVVAQSPPLTPFRGLIDHVSADQWGGASAGAEVWHRAISGDGRYVVFNSPADLVADNNDYNGLDDIFLRDRSTGTTTRVSMASDGGPGNGLSQMGTISTNGRHVAFASGSSNLVPGDTNSHWDVFVRDFDQQRTVRISELGGIPGDRDSYYPAISADGRFVAFLSWASTFAPGVSPNSPRQLYLHDRDADGNGIFDEPGYDNMELVSAGLSGEIADASVDTPHVSSDGRYVLFESSATNLTSSGNSNGQNHLYRRDRQTGQTEMIDRAVTGGPSSWGIAYGTSDMTDEGRFITFSSISPDIVWFDMNWQSQVFLYDTVGGPTATTIVSRLPDGTVGDGSGYASSVSADGRYVVFTTAASNLASPPPGASGPAMLAVRDMLDGTFTRVDVLDSGDAFDDSDYYYTAAISADGSAIVLQSRSQQAVGGQFTWGASHVFVMTALSATPQSASFSMAGGSGAIEVDTSAVSGWNAVTNDPWIVLMDGSGFGAGPRTVHYEVSPNPSGIVRHGSIRIGSKVVAIHQEGDGDTTPPVITPIVTGTQVNGWYTSDITVSFEVSDPDSEVVDQSYNCTHTLTFTTDFLYGTPQCEATSHGGTTAVTVPLRRDTTPPIITITEPKATIYGFGAIVWPVYSCYDPYSGATDCTGPSMSSPLDTWTRGRNVFTVTSTDEAGNTATTSVEYIVGTDECVTSPLAPANMKRWYTFNGTYRDGIRGMDAFDNLSAGTFQPGIAGQAWDNWSAWNFLWAGDAPSALAGPSGLTVAMWVKPRGSFPFYPIPQYQSFVFNPMQYQVVRWLDGTLRWRFNTTAGFDWVNTGVHLWSNTWYHVAVTYNDGVVRSYVNGRLVHSQALSGTLISGPNVAGLQLAGQNGLNLALNGSLDDVMIFDAALPASDIDNLALSGSGSLCGPFASNLTATAPPTVVYGSYFLVEGTLTDGFGRPLQYRPLTISSATTPGYVYEDHLTDGNGWFRVSFPISSEVPIGEFPDGITVTFAGDGTFGPVEAHASITVLPGTPTVYWPQPGPITYGTPLGAAQLNAASGPGTFVYSPPAGTVLEGGTNTLSVTYTPDDSHWAQRTVTTTIVVNKATPTVEISTAPVVYNGSARSATVAVRGVGGVELSPFAVRYNGSTAAPVNAGTYALEVQFAGNVNYEAVTATGSFVVNKATPTVTATGGTFTYDRQPHAGSGAAVGVLGEALSPVTLTYDGSTSTPPTNAGAHTVRASYAGSANYLSGQSADAVLTINRATPTVEISSAPVWYTSYPRPATVVVHGVGTDELNPFTVLYNGSAAAPVNAGTYALQVQYAGSANYEPITATGSFVVNKATPIIGTLNDITETYDGQPHGVNVNIAGVAGEWLTPVIMTYNGSTALPVNAGVYAAEVRYDGSTNYNAISRTYTLTILKAVPYLQWGYPASITYGTALGASQLNPSSNVPGTFAFSPAAGTVLNAGSHTLTATFTPNDTTNYTSPSISRPISVSKATVYAVWYRPDNLVYGTPLGPTQLNATAAVPGTFTYSPPAGTLLGAGEYVLHVTFTPDDTSNYDGSSVGVGFTVTKVTPVVSWNSPPDIVYGTALGANELNATANAPGTLTYSPATGALLGAGPQTLSVTFTPDDAANYNSATASVTLNVAKAASTLTWPIPADIVYGTALGASQLNATANVAGTFTYSPGTGAILDAGPQPLTVAFTPTDAANYTGANASVLLNVTKAVPTLTWPTPADIVYGTALGASQLNATANVAGTLVYLPAAGAILNAGTQTLEVTFTPDDAANYTGATVDVTLNVTKAASTISWSNLADIVYGTALGAAQLNATANVAGTFAYSPAWGSMLNAGSHALSVTFTPSDSINYVPATANVSIVVTRATPVVSWSNPAGITYGTALSGTQLNASANVAGSFAYSPAAGTVLDAGTQQLSVTFTPADAANYNGSSADVSLQVSKAASTVSWSNPAGIVYGTALGATQLNATANVAGTFSYSPAAGAVLNAGSQTLSVTFTPTDAANYNSATASVAISIAPKALTVQTNNATKVYGAALPAFTASGTGFVNGDSMSSLAGTLSFTTSATATSAPGSYAVTPSGVSSANYSITFANGTLTVTTAATSTAFTTTPNPSNNNQSVQLRAVVSAVAPGAGTATGTVEFRENGTLLGTATLVNGVATMNKSFKRGTHPLTATYTGSTNFTASSGSVTHQTQ